MWHSQRMAHSRVARPTPGSTHSCGSRGGLGHVGWGGQGRLPERGFGETYLSRGSGGREPGLKEVVTKDHRLFTEGKE